MFWSQMWHNIEVLTSRYASWKKVNSRRGPWKKEMTQRVIRLFVLAKDNPTLASQVQLALARNLSLFPNLNSFRLHTGDRSPVDEHEKLYQSFSKYQYPSVKKLSLAHGQIIIARSCPNLQQLSVSSCIAPVWEDSKQGWDDMWWMKPPFPAESIQCLNLCDGILRAKDIVRAMPNLRVLELYETTSAWRPQVACSALRALTSLPPNKLARLKVVFANVPMNVSILLQLKGEEVASLLRPGVQLEVY